MFTNRLRPGYVRKNGVPYGPNTTMTEYYHRMTAPNGDIWLTIVAEIVDSDNLREPFVAEHAFQQASRQRDVQDRNVRGSLMSGARCEG